MVDLLINTLDKEDIVIIDGVAFSRIFNNEFEVLSH